MSVPSRSRPVVSTARLHMLREHENLQQHRMKSLNLGASCAPRMLHAASQIQASSDLSVVLFILWQ